MEDSVKQDFELDITFLGTGAADWPCMEDSRRKGADFDYRRHSSILVDSFMLIDCGSYIFDSFNSFGIDYLQISDILITHSHDDHYCLGSIKKLAAQKDKGAPLNIWADISLAGQFEGCENIVCRCISPFERFTVGDIEVTALPANHGGGLLDKETPYHYILARNSQKVFYGCDGAWLLYQSYQEMRKHVFDAMIMDSTIGVTANSGVFGHNSFDMLKIMHIAFIADGIISKDTPFIASHLAITLYPSYEDTKKMFEPCGIINAFDGMKIYV